MCVFEKKQFSFSGKKVFYTFYNFYNPIIQIVIYTITTTTYFYNLLHLSLISTKHLFFLQIDSYFYICRNLIHLIINNVEVVESVEAKNVCSGK